MKAAEIARAAGGRLTGNGEVEIAGLADIEHAVEGDVTFLAHPRYRPFLETTRASAVIVGEDCIYDGDITLIVCPNPSAAFAKVTGLFDTGEEELPAGIAEGAVIGPDGSLASDADIGAHAVIGTNVTIGPRSVIMPLAYIGSGVTIGADCRVYPQVSILSGTRLGDRVTVHSGTVIGSDGYGYETVQGIHTKIPQVGTVEIGDNVEIGACVTIDRARFGRTVIGAGTKIDNLVQIAHNVRIGRNCLIVSQVGISGSTVIGDGVTMAGRSGSFGHVRIGDGAVLSALAVASKDIPAGKMMSGFPARPVDEHRRTEAARLKLPALLKRLRALEKKVSQLESQAKND